MKKQKLQLIGLCVCIAAIAILYFFIKVSIMQHLGFPWWYMFFINK